MNQKQYVRNSVQITFKMNINAHHSTRSLAEVFWIGGILQRENADDTFDVLMVEVVYLNKVSKQ